MDNILVDISIFHKFDICTNNTSDITTNSPENESETQFLI